MHLLLAKDGQIHLERGMVFVILLWLERNCLVIHLPYNLFTKISWENERIQLGTNQLYNTDESALPNRTLVHAGDRTTLAQNTSKESITFLAYVNNYNIIKYHFFNDMNENYKHDT